MKRCATPGERDAGFTLIELLIAVVLGSIIAGVTVAALATSMNVVSSTTDQVNDSTDAGLISALLYRDAQSAGTTDPATARLDPRVGVSVENSAAGWGGCEQAGRLVVRFSWVDRSSTGREVVVATYALDGAKLLVRRLCSGGGAVDATLGRSIASARASCSPGPTCAGLPGSVSLALTGSGRRAPYAYTLTASLRGGAPTAPDRANSSVVALAVLGDTVSSSSCPNLQLDDNGTITVIGDAVVGSECGPSPISGDRSTLRPTGELAVVRGITDPFFALTPPPSSCAGRTNPSPIGDSPSPTSITEYPARVTISDAVTMRPGRYVFCDGLDIGPGGALTGSDVLLYLAGGTLTVDEDATLNLWAASSGTYSNLLLWIATSDDIELTAGARVSTYGGVVYAPTAQLTVAGRSASNIGGVVAAKVTFANSAGTRLGLPVPALSTRPGQLPPGQVGLGYSATVDASGGSAPYAYAADGLPPGLSIDASTGLISGNPTRDGSFAVILTTLDATAVAATTDYTIVVAPALRVSGPAALAAGQVSMPYPDTAFSAAGGAGSLSWSASGLPPGIAIAPASGVLSGTPAASGSFDTVISVTDSMGAVASSSYTIAVNEALSWTGPATLAPARHGSAYPATTVSASGGTAPYTWTATGLPPGLTIDPATGEIGGTPLAVGAFQPTATVTVTVTDAVSATSSATYTMTVDRASCPANPGGWLGEYYANATLSGDFSLCRDDPAIDFDWAAGPPAPGLPADDFSVRWTRVETFAAGSYTFTIGTDDGGRLYVDGLLLLDRWFDQAYPSPQPTVAVSLTAGDHTVVFEYYERGGAARATLVLSD